MEQRKARDTREGEGQPASAARLLSQTPSTSSSASTVPPPSRAAREMPVHIPPMSGAISISEAGAPRPTPGEHRVNAGLAPTIAEWVPVSGERQRTGAASYDSAGATGGMTSYPADPLEAVGLHEGAIIDNKYRIERALGVGGMGSVALAVDERLDRKVAIKFIKPELFAFPEMRTFFHNEARAMARVGHRNVLSVFAFGEHEGTPYFVMEYVEGRTVEQWLRAREGGTFPDLNEAVRILEQACLGVEAIHATSTIHRDLKPSNLLIDQSFRVAVGDLGVARVLDSAVNGNFVVGSAAYMAPEAALGEDEAPELANRRDVYALGCIAYELLVGRPPFSGETDMSILSQHVLQDPVPPSRIRPGLPLGWDEFIAKALAKDPLKRFPSVEAFRKAMMAEHSGTREPERILIADDDDDWRELIVSSLRERFPNAVIDQVGDGERALEAFEKNPYSCVLVDLQMPQMDGAKLTLLLRSVESSARIPIIVLTAAGGPREWQRLSAIGADAFLVKPVNADDVELVIRRTMRSRHTSPPSGGSMPSAPVSI
ncbi:MAG: serine/threonine protein kinase [Labilithrix sp.]|nr:serine/threonine protein kinase [Labilithrix sp.]